jgi:hypothetical protein
MNNHAPPIILPSCTQRIGAYWCLQHGYSHHLCTSIIDLAQSCVACEPPIAEMMRDQPYPEGPERHRAATLVNAVKACLL